MKEPMHNHAHHHHNGMNEPKYPWIVTILSFGFLVACIYLSSLFVPISFS